MPASSAVNVATSVSTRTGRGPAGLDAGEVEQVVDQPLQALAVAHGEARAARWTSSGQRLGGVVEDVADRAEQQRQRRPQLVADVGEEGGLGAVELGEGLRPPPLGLEGPDVDHRAGELAGHQLVERAVRRRRAARFGLLADHAAAPSGSPSRAGGQRQDDARR